MGAFPYVGPSSSVGTISDPRGFCSVSVQAEVSRLLNASVSVATKRVYDTGLDRFEDFRRSCNAGSDWPPTLRSVVEFVAYLSTQEMAPSTVKSYLSGISFKCKLNGFADVTQFFIVKKMISGLSRLNDRVDSRLPISPELLVKIIQTLPLVCSSSYESALFAALFSVAYYGFLRVGELVVANKSDFGHALLAHNVSVCDSQDMVQIKLPHSKTDQMGKGVVISLTSNESLTCPVYLVKQYLSLRKQLPGVFFCHVNSSPVTRFQFSSVLRKSLNAVGVRSERYKSHSFRVGAATFAAMQGFSEEKIKELGRWESRAFKNYIRIPTNELL